MKNITGTIFSLDFQNQIINFCLVSTILLILSTLLFYIQELVQTILDCVNLINVVVVFEEVVVSDLFTHFGKAGGILIWACLSVGGSFS